MFGNVIRTHRRRLGLTQDELAEHTGLSVRSIRDLEAGRIGQPRLSTMRLLADAFGLSGADRESFLESATADVAPPVREKPVPRQLPADVADFSGRTEHLSRLTSIVEGGTAQPTAVVITAIAGTAGVGKTALAVHWAHQVADRFPDGQLYVNLRGFDPTGAVMKPGEAIRGFLDALDVSPGNIAKSLEAQAAQYRTLLTGKRMLVVLDNARDAEQVRPLLPGSPTVLLLVTSRSQLSSLVAAEGARPLTLDLLTAAESLDLLVQRLGADRVAAERPAVDEIIARCARLPLALNVVAARAANHPSFPLATLAAELREANGGLDALMGEDPATDVRAVFSWSYRTLEADAARLFRLLGLHAGPDISAPAAASLAGHPVARVRPMLAALARTHLITEHAPGRYTFHDLLRAYARELTDGLDSPAERDAAMGRILDHYLHSCRSATQQLRPNRRLINTPDPRDGAEPERFTDHERALGWLTAEHHVIVAATAQAAATGYDIHAWQLVWTLRDYFNRLGHWNDWAIGARAGLDAAVRAGDRDGQARMHTDLGIVSSQLLRQEDARTHLGLGLELFRELEDPVSQATAHIGLAYVADRAGRTAEALENAQQALDLYRTAGIRGGQANALNGVGWYHARLGNHQEALEHCRQALALLEELDDRHGQAGTWDSIGYVHHQLGQYQLAATCFERAVEMYRELADRHQEAATLGHLGEAHEAAGGLDAAQHAWRLAVSIYDDLKHPDGDAIRAKLAPVSRI